MVWNHLWDGVGQLGGECVHGLHLWSAQQVCTQSCVCLSVWPLGLDLLFCNPLTLILAASIPLNPPHRQTLLHKPTYTNPNKHIHKNSHVPHSVTYSNASLHPRPVRVILEKTPYFWRGKQFSSEISSEICWPSGWVPCPFQAHIVGSDNNSLKPKDLFVCDMNMELSFNSQALTLSQERTLTHRFCYFSQSLIQDQLSPNPAQNNNHYELNKWTTNPDLGPVMWLLCVLRLWAVSNASCSDVSQDLTWSDFYISIHVYIRTTPSDLSPSLLPSVKLCNDTSNRGSHFWRHSQKTLPVRTHWLLHTHRSLHISVVLYRDWIKLEERWTGRNDRW